MWLIERESGFQKGLLQWSYTTTLFPKWNPKIFNLKELSLRCLKAGLLSQPCKTLSGRQMKRSTPHSKTDYTVKANVLVSTRKLTGGRRELQEMFQSLPAPYYTHNNPVKHTKPSEINLHMICHFQILHLSDIPRSLLKGQGSWGILWSSDVLLCCVLQAHMEHLLWAAGSDARLLREQQPAVQTQHSPAFSACVPPPHHIFPWGSSTTTVS